MKALLVNASPHKEGCTYTALMECAKTLNEEEIGTDYFWVGNKALNSCIACKKCRETGKCVFSDRVNEFLDIAGSYDGFLFGSPVHWGGADGALTSFLGRAFYADLNAGSGRFTYKPASAVISARRAGSVSTFDQINRFLTLMQMPIVTSRYWPIVFGAKPEEVLQDGEGMQTMRILGRNMAYMLKCLEAGRKAKIELPRQEEKTEFTNFIR